jgi:cyanophycinase
LSACVALIGGEEFADGFEDVHAGLLADIGNGARRVVYLPTCASHDGPEVVEYWCDLARRRLGALGAAVETPKVVDEASANDARNARLVAEADWIYLGGGFPHVAMRILPGTRVMAALEAARVRGALITGASAGAMLMCARSFVITPDMSAHFDQALSHGRSPDWNPPLPPALDCLGWVPRSLCAPHFDRIFPTRWLEQGLLPTGFTLIGIDEQTALVNTRGGWEVRGRGAVTLIGDDRTPVRYVAGQQIML